jgi:hypothetical protein
MATLSKDDNGNIVQDGANTFAHYSTNQTTTAVKATPGVLSAVVINTKGTVASVTTIYDSNAAASNVIAVIDSLNLSGTFTFNVKTTVGITISTTGTAAPDVTVIYH